MRRAIVIAGGILAAGMSAFGGIQAWEWLDSKHDQGAQVLEIGGDVKSLKQEALITRFLRRARQLDRLEEKYGRNCQRGDREVREWCQDIREEKEDLRRKIEGLK